MKNFNIVFFFLLFLAIGGFVVASTCRSNTPDPISRNLINDPIVKMEQELEDLRKDFRIPGMSAAISGEKGILWSKGFGWADKELQIPATEKSLFHLASLTKPYATIVILQLVEEGRLNLNSPVSEFGIILENNQNIKVKHLLSHTSTEVPGTIFKYDGNRFAELEKVIEEVTGNSFAQELRNRVLEPLKLDKTVPNPLDSIAFKEAGANVSLVKDFFVTEYARKWGRIFWPSGLFGPLVPINSPEYFGTAAGLVSTASDVAMFSTAWDNGLLINNSLNEKALTPFRSPLNKNFPFGLGWFIENYDGHLIAWQYGHWFGSSSLIVKVPEKKITFVILANSDGLSRGTRIGDKATINASPVAHIFLEKLFNKEFDFQ